MILREAIIETYNEFYSLDKMITERNKKVKEYIQNEIPYVKDTIDKALRKCSFKFVYKKLKMHFDLYNSIVNIYITSTRQQKRKGNYILEGHKICVFLPGTRKILLTFIIRNDVLMDSIGQTIPFIKYIQELVKQDLRLKVFFKTIEDCDLYTKQEIDTIHYSLSDCSISQKLQTIDNIFIDNLKYCSQLSCSSVRIKEGMSSYIITIIHSDTIERESIDELERVDVGTVGGIPLVIAVRGIDTQIIENLLDHTEVTFYSGTYFTMENTDNVFTAR